MSITPVMKCNPSAKWLHRKCLTSFPEKLAICVLERNPQLHVLRKTGKDDLMKQRNGEMRATAYVLGILLK
jgi:hypothetical protein